MAGTLPEISRAQWFKLAGLKKGFGVKCSCTNPSLGALERKGCVRYEWLGASSGRDHWELTALGEAYLGRHGSPA